MTNNVGLTFSVGDIVPWFTIRIGDTNLSCRVQFLIW
jgi:hypothetical protein